MALDNTPTGLVTLIASADLSAKQYYIVKVDSNGEVALAAAGEAAIGVLYDKPTARGQVCQVAPLVPGAKLKAITAAVIAPGALVASDANGKLGAVTKGKVDTSDGGAAADPVIGSHVLGVKLGSANSASGDITEFMALPMGAVPTTAA